MLGLFFFTIPNPNWDKRVCEDNRGTAWMGEESLGLLQQSVTAQGVKMTVAHEFETLNQAASALLVETCGLLNERRLGYVVAGGWVPVLRCIAPDLHHPGTRDV